MELCRKFGSNLDLLPKTVAGGRRRDEAPCSRFVATGVCNTNLGVALALEHPLYFALAGSFLLAGFAAGSLNILEGSIRSEWAKDVH